MILSTCTEPKPSILEVDSAVALESKTERAAKSHEASPESQFCEKSAGNAACEAHL